MPVRRRDGTIVLRQLADVIADGTVVPMLDEIPDCGGVPCEGGGGGGGGGGAGGTYLYRLVTINVYDSFPWETNEFEFRQRGSTGRGTIPGLE